MLFYHCLCKMESNSKLVERRDCMYIKRHIEEVIVHAKDHFKVLLITGPRQVGKSTLLKHLLKDEYNYVSLDDIIALKLAKDDPRLFFENHPMPVVIDEVQKAPELFVEIKRMVDESDEYGKIILTGSQTFSLMAGVTETLAGRVGIYELGGLSFREINHVSRRNSFVPSNTFLDLPIEETDHDLWTFIFKGDLPELYKNKNLDPTHYYSSYVKTYIERDVRSIVNVLNLDKFSRFLIAFAARTAQIVNYSHIASEVGVDIKTIQSWVKVLEASGLIKIIEPFSNNKIKRMIKSPVVYFLNTGLVSYLLKWTSAETLKNGAFSGEVLETYVFNEIYKTFKNNGNIDPSIYYYRDVYGNEIDLIIEQDGVLYPIEIKKTMNPKKEMTKSFKQLDKAVGFKVGNEIILSLLDRKVKFGDKLYSYPIEKI